MPLRYQGTLKWYDNSKGYGEIINKEGPDLVFYARSLQNAGRRDLAIGQPVTFEIQITPHGYEAVNVTVEAPEPQSNTQT
jgi:CspA family cold shock protein